MASRIREETKTEMSRIYDAPVSDVDADSIVGNMVEFLRLLATWDDQPPYPANTNHNPQS